MNVYSRRHQRQARKARKARKRGLCGCIRNGRVCGEPAVDEGFCVAHLQELSEAAAMVAGMLSGRAGQQP